MDTDGLRQSLRVLLATKDQGIIAVSVQSGASLASKHRALLVPGSHIVVDMVRGYRGYLLTGIHEIGGEKPKLASLFLGRIGIWATHYLGIETAPYRELYDLSRATLSILLHATQDSPSFREALSLWILESILALGGYRENPPGWDEAHIADLLAKKSEIRAILDATQLRRKSGEKRFGLW
jgi:hypothetical protein